MLAKLTSLLLLSTSVHALPPSLDIRQASSTAKAGLAWPNGPYNDIDQYRSTGKVQWYYTWSPSPVPTDLEFVPMLWGARQVAEWSRTISDTIRRNHVTHALGFNEPQQAGQSDLSPEDGASIWKAQIEPLKAQGILLGSPAPSSAPSGKTWLLDWMKACGGWDGSKGGCTVDFVALHWYDVNSTAFIRYLEDFHDTFQKPIWVTEWACQNFNHADQQCSQQDIVDFMNTTQSFMDNTDWVERYSWFGAMRNLSGVNQWNALMTNDGHLTTLGKQYIGAVTPNISSDPKPGVVHGGKGDTSGPIIESAALKSTANTVAIIAAASAINTLNDLFTIGLM
ncbi:glycosyl hydrolase catalytic core-domain-containing protein [Cristinia sonorae]|uniref:Glycosyl hydrolase catalytic core-domain-containing protein n=1 Tax=Cristinia sonorae TaxID=1940300 RepID=A0A8K0UUL6_9AGAR|nr:glycosyl hydrolase catalytic core-domain-containing protein [Cristinia sonorae]